MDNELLTPAELEQLRQEVNTLMPSHQLRLDPTWARKVLRTLDRATSCGSDCDACSPTPSPAEASTDVVEVDVLELNDDDDTDEASE